MHRGHAKSAQKNVSETLSWRANNAPKHIKTHQTPTITQKNASKSCRNTQNCADSVFDIFRSTFVQHSFFLFRKSAGRGCFLRKTPFLLASVEIGIFFCFREERKGSPRKRERCLFFVLIDTPFVGWNFAATLAVSPRSAAGQCKRNLKNTAKKRKASVKKRERGGQSAKCEKVLIKSDKK